MLRENVDFSAVTCQVWLPGFVAMLSQERGAGGFEGGGYTTNCQRQAGPESGTSLPTGESGVGTHKRSADLVISHSTEPIISGLELTDAHSTISSTFTDK